MSGTEVTDERAHEIVAAKIDAFTALQVRDWLRERHANCHRHAKMNPIHRDDWLDDAAYFAAAIGLIDWTAAEEEARS